MGIFDKINCCTEKTVQQFVFLLNMQSKGN